MPVLFVFRFRFFSLFAPFGGTGHDYLASLSLKLDVRIRNARDRSIARTSTTLQAAVDYKQLPSSIADRKNVTVIA